MVRPKTKERYIKAETVCIGDTVRVTTKIHDVTLSIVGTVATKDRHLRGTDVCTAGGTRLYHVGPTMIPVWDHDSGENTTVTITLLNRPQDQQIPLWKE